MKLAEFVRHPYPVRVVLCPDRKSWDRLHKELGVKSRYPKRAFGVVSQYFGASNLLVVAFPSVNPRKRLKPEAFETFVHESVHLARFIAQYIYGQNSKKDLKLDIESEAYLTQALFGWLVATYEEFRK